LAKEFVHLIITRFNLAIEFGNTKRKNSNVPDMCAWLDQEYLKKRFMIFEKYTFQSLLQQSEQNFIWLVLFHKDTPDQYKNRIAELCHKMKQMVPLFFNDEECERFQEILSDYIYENWKNINVITTRMDNDDIVHYKFVEQIQKDIKKESLTILTYENGLQYDIQSKQMLKCKDRQNHFLSLYAKGGGEHILLYNHAYIFQSAKMRNIQFQIKRTYPMWVEIITENNYSNALRWRFSSVMVPFTAKIEFPLLELNYTTRIKWVKACFLGIFKVFFYRGRNLISIILYQK